MSMFSEVTPRERVTWTLRTGGEQPNGPAQRESHLDDVERGYASSCVRRTEAIAKLRRDCA